MQIHTNTLIAECSAYDFKEMLERKKVKSWLKSVSAFANTDGGSLFYGVNDDGVIVGLENPQADADFISEMIKARLDPVPEVQLIPIEHEGHTLLEVKVKAGTLTPYYYYQDGTRTAYVRVGNESVECNSQQLLSLVLKGTHMTWDSLPTQVNASKHSFIILANTFHEQTHQEWNDKYLESFGLVTPDGKLTNAGLLFVDNCTVFQSRIFCTRWTGLYKDDAISSVEHRANLVLLLKYGMDFFKNKSKTVTYTKCRPCVVTLLLRICLRNWTIWRNVALVYEKCGNSQRNCPISCLAKNHNIKRKRLLSTPRSII